MLLIVFCRVVTKQLYCSMKITPKEYADSRGISLQAVTKQIRLNRSLPGISKYEKFGRFYLLTPYRNMVKEKVSK